MATEKPTEGAPPLRLYNAAVSSCAQRLRIALNLKGLEYEYLARTDTGKEANFFSDQDLDAINARGQIPVLAIDGEYLAESSAILEYLEETRPESFPLLPKDPKKRAYVRKDRIEEKLGKEERLGWAQYYIDKGLTAVEENLKSSAGKYAVGDEVTMVRWRDGNR